MTTTLTGGLELKSDWQFQETDELGPTTQTKVFKVTHSYEHGSGANQIQQLYRARRTVTLATSVDDIDLAGVLLNPVKDTIEFAAIRELIIYNRATTAGEDLLVGGAGAVNNAWGAPFGGDPDAQAVCRAGGLWIVSAPLDGLSVASGSSDVLRITHDGTAGDIDYDIVIKGTL